MEDDLSRQALMENDFGWKATLGGRRPLMEDLEQKKCCSKLNILTQRHYLANTIGQDLGLQCQIPLKGLKLTVTIVTWPLSYKSMCKQDLSLKCSAFSSGSLQVSKSQNRFLSQKSFCLKKIWIQTNFGSNIFFASKQIVGPKNIWVLTRILVLKKKGGMTSLI